MRLLGIDYGEKRVGLAITDETCLTVRPLAIVPTRSALKEISLLVERQQVGTVVVGLPLSMDGELHHKENFQAFLEQLKETISVPVETQDERLTTVESERLLSSKRRKNVDSLAAAIILQDYLASR